MRSVILQSILFLCIILLNISAIALADEKVSQLPSKTTADNADLFYLVDSSTNPVSSKNITFSNFQNSITHSQWTTLGNNIYNNNTGNVGIGTQTPIQPFVVNGESIFKGPIADVRSYGVIGDGATDDTTAMQNAINSCSSAGYTCFFPSKTYEFSNEISIPSNTYIYVESGAIFNQTNSSLGKSAWVMNGVSNVFIWAYGATWNWNPRPATGQQGHDFGILGATNIWIWGAAANNAGGDGFLVGEDSNASLFWATNVHIVDCKANNSLRNAMSVSGAQHLRVENFQGTNSNGSAPQMGIDIEPNDNTQTLEDIVFDNLYTGGNVSSGFNVSLSLLAGSTPKHVSINVINHHDFGSFSGVSFQGVGVGTYILDGKINIVNDFSNQAKGEGVLIRNYDALAPRITLDHQTVIDPNVNNSGDPTVGSGIVVRRDSVGSNAVGNTAIESPVIIDDRVSPLIVDGIYVNDPITPGPMTNVSIEGEIFTSGVSSVINTGNSAAMLLLNNGNVGIGLINPGEQLDVNGTIRGANLFTSGGASSYLNASGGNVGIGTTLPAHPLDVIGTINGNGFSSLGNVGISTTAPTTCGCKQYTNGLCTTVGTCS